MCNLNKTLIILSNIYFFDSLVVSRAPPDRGGWLVWARHATTTCCSSIGSDRSSSSCSSSYACRLHPCILRRPIHHQRGTGGAPGGLRAAGVIRGSASTCFPAAESWRRWCRQDPPDGASTCQTPASPTSCSHASC